MTSTVDSIMTFWSQLISFFVTLYRDICLIFGIKSKPQIDLAHEVARLEALKANRSRKIPNAKNVKKSTEPKKTTSSEKPKAKKTETVKEYKPQPNESNLAELIGTIDFSANDVEEEQIESAESVSQQSIKAMRAERMNNSVLKTFVEPEIVVACNAFKSEQAKKVASISSAARSTPIETRVDALTTAMTTLNELKTSAIDEAKTMVSRFNKIDLKNLMHTINLQVSLLAKNGISVNVPYVSHEFDITEDMIKELIMAHESNLDDQHSSNKVNVCKNYLTEIKTNQAIKLMNEWMNDFGFDVEEEIRALKGSIELARSEATLSIVSKKLKADFPDIKADKVIVAAFEGDCPPYLVRKVEQKFQVQIQRYTGQQAKIFGMPGAIKSANQFVKTAHTAFKNVDKKFLGAIVGRQGANISKIEQDTNTVCMVSPNQLAHMSTPSNEVIAIYGLSPDTIKACEIIENTVTKQASTACVIEVEVPYLVARALLSVNKSEITTLEDKFETKILVATGDGPRDADGKPKELKENEKRTPRVFCRCSEEHKAELESTIRKIVSSLNVTTLKGINSRSVVRVIFPTNNVKNPKNPPRSVSLHKKWCAIRDEHAVYTQKEGPMDAPICDLHVVMPTAKATTILASLNELLEAADYMTEEFPLMRDQLRCINNDLRADIERESGVKLVVINNPTSGSLLILTGTRAEIDDARQVIAEILSQHANVKEFNFPSDEAISHLFRNKAELLREIEKKSECFISIDRPTLLATVVGTEEAVEIAVGEFKALCADVAQIEKVNIKVHAKLVPTIIGKGGVTIKKMRAVSGIENIEVPRAEADAEFTIISVIGKPEACAEVEDMILEIMDEELGSDVDEELVVEHCEIDEEPVTVAEPAVIMKTYQQVMAEDFPTLGA